MFQSVPARLCCGACLHRRLPQCIAPAFHFSALSVVRRVLPKLLLCIDRCAQHSGSVSENRGDDRAAAIRNPQCMGIQNFTGVLQQPFAHTGHAAADNDDFGIVQAENGAQTVAQQLSGFLHGLNGDRIPVIVGTGKHVSSDLIKVIIYPVTDDAVLSLLDFFPEGAQDAEGGNIAPKAAGASAAAFPSFAEHVDMPDFACGAGSAVDHASVDDCSAAKPGSEGNHQDVIAVFAGAEFPFTVQVYAGVIVDVSWNVQMTLHPGDDRNLLPFRKIRGKTGNPVFDIEDAGNADAHAGDILTGQVQFVQKRKYRVINAVENMLRAETNLCGRPLFAELMKRVIENRNFNIGSTEIKPDIGCHKNLPSAGALRRRNREQNFRFCSAINGCFVTPAAQIAV